MGIRIDYRRGAVLEGRKRHLLRGKTKRNNTRRRGEGFEEPKKSA